MIVLVINALLQVYPAWASIIGAPPPPNQWRTQDFRIEGVEALRVWGVGRGYPLPRFFRIFLFKVAYFDAF